MQRDAYAALIKKRHKHKVPLRILHSDGSVVHERIFDEVFDGYRMRRLVLMTHMRGVPRHLPRLPHDVMVQNFTKLLQVHQPHFVYQLLPLMCSSAEAFVLMQALCAEKGSPFTIGNRRDPAGLTYRFLNYGANRADVCEVFKPYISSAEWAIPAEVRKLPISGVQFDGVLLSERRVVGSGAPPRDRSLALLTIHDTVGEKQLVERGLLREFYNHPVYTRLAGNTELMADVRHARHQYHVMGSLKPISPDNLPMRKKIIQQAQEKHLLLYEHINDTFAYCAPV